MKNNGHVQLIFFFSTSEKLRDIFAQTTLEKPIFSFKVIWNHTIKSPPFSIFSEPLKDFIHNPYMQGRSVWIVSFTTFEGCLELILYGGGSGRDSSIWLTFTQILLTRTSLSEGWLLAFGDLWPDTLVLQRTFKFNKSGLLLSSCFLHRLR